MTTLEELVKDAPVYTKGETLNFLAEKINGMKENDQIEYLEDDRIICLRRYISDGKSRAYAILPEDPDMYPMPRPHCIVDNDIAIDLRKVDKQDYYKELFEILTLAESVNDIDTDDEDFEEAWDTQTAILDQLQPYEYKFSYEVRHLHTEMVLFRTDDLENAKSYYAKNTSDTYLYDAIKRIEIEL